jgi:CHAT domain-containing protein
VRGFFYAGARSLLASHWYVESGAVVRLTTRAVAELENEPGMGQAEALRRSMIALLDSGEGWTSHPSLWAPFVLVGEGGR